MSETDQRLTWMLRKLADDFGAAGVAKVAAEMIGARVEDLPSECDLHPEDCETDYVLDLPDEAVGHYKLVCLTHDGDHAPGPPDNPEAVQRELDLHADLRVARARVSGGGWGLRAALEAAQREQVRLHESRDAAEARARRAEGALRELTEAAFRLCVAVDIHPERLRPTLRREADKCRQALDWARAALSAAGQTSDTTPSDRGDQ